MTQIIRRKDAIAQGLTKYFTGKPCKQGHVCERYVDSGVCKACVYANEKRFRSANTTLVYARNSEWRRAKPDYDRQYYSANTERVKQYAKEWKERNPDQVAIMQDRRGELLKRATPPWAEHDLINMVYKKRDELNQAWDTTFTVDHIIPIQSDTVCGLHCWSNLQLLCRTENGQKRNKYQQDW